MSTQQKKLLIIAAGIMLIIVPLAIYFYVQQQNQSRANQEQQLVGSDSVDPASGLTITESQREHEEGGRGVTFLGMSHLVERGISMPQLTEIEDSFRQLDPEFPNRLDRISVYKDSIESAYKDEGETRTRLLRFKIQVNQKDDYIAEVSYVTLTSLTLRIYDKAGETLLYEL